VIEVQNEGGKRSCLTCKSFSECSAFEQIIKVKDTLLEASMYLNESFLGEVMKRLDEACDAFAEKCKDYEHQSPEEALKKTMSSLTNALGAISPIFATLAVIATVDAEEDEEDGLLHKEASRRKET